MAIILKPILKSGLTLDDQLENDSKYFENKLKELKFEPPSPLNQLKKLLIYLVLLFAQKKPDHKKDIAAKNKLISSFKALNPIEESNSFVQSKLNEIKSITLEYLKQQKSQQDNLRGKIKKINSKNSEARELKKSAEMHKGAKEMIDMLRAITAANPVEHEIKLQESYALLKMQPWLDGESKEGFLNRLTDTTTDAYKTAKADDTLVDKADAYKYLRDFASPSSIKPPPTSGVNKEETENNTSSIASLKHR